MRARALLAATMTAAAFVTGAEAQATTAPSLQVVKRAPLSVRGTGFEPGEKVGVRLSLRGKVSTRRAVAGAAGALTVRFAVSVRACERFSLQAFGSAGSRARLLSLRPLPACIAPDSGTR